VCPFRRGAKRRHDRGGAERTSAGLLDPGDVSDRQGEGIEDVQATAASAGAARGDPMFKHSGAFSSFSVDDVARARRFYVESLGLSATDEMGGLRLHLPDGVDVFVYPKPDHKAANFTVLNFIVEDIDVAVEELTNSGVEFEHYEGALQTDDKGIFRGAGPKIAWFKDPAGNIFSVLVAQ
jgi:catechol 2,3-dioxygenase-like lactoylglutathione lyase family enzyme